MQGHTILVSHCFQLKQRLSGLEGNDSGILGCVVEQESSLWPEGSV